MASVPPTANLATQASWSRRADSSVWLPSRNSSARGGGHSGASTPDRATTPPPTAPPPPRAHRHPDVLSPRVGDRATEPGQRVDEAHRRVDEGRVVVLPARLVLLGAAVVIHRHHLAARLARGGGEVERRLAHPAAHLEQRPGDGDGAGRLVQGPALVVGHEPRRRLGGGEQVGRLASHRANLARSAVIRRSVATPASVSAAFATSAPTAVVTGTASTRAIEPTSVRMTSSATAELVSTVQNGWW